MSQLSDKNLTLAQLNDAEQELCKAALDQRLQAYAPYSHFSVGAALRCEQGEVFVGCNVENASFGLTVCAERHAVAAAVSAGQQKFKQMAIASDMQAPASPCGACRQVLNEFAPQLEILLVNIDGVVERTRLDLLLPRSFNGEMFRSDNSAKQVSQQPLSNASAGKEPNDKAQGES